MTALQPREFLLYYAGVLLIALIVFMRRRPRKGMRLRLGSGRRRERVGGAETGGGRSSELGGKAQAPPAKENFSHIKPRGERPLNVVFNYNGHSWDAYEVLGLPAGSSLENVEAAYQESLLRVDDPSRPFIEAAYLAIRRQWDGYRAG